MNSKKQGEKTMNKQNKFNANKITTCKHCIEMLKMANKWIMPSETQSWKCLNCARDYNITSYTEQDDNPSFSSAQIMQINRDGDLYKIYYFDTEKQKFFEVSQ